MRRREFLRRTALSAALGAAFARGRACGGEAAAPQPPNIIVILADDLGYGDIGCYGQTAIPTPQIDRMAAEGMRLTRHYAGSTVCAPSRCVIMTGKHTGHASVRTNGAMQLLEGEPTIPSVLRAAGYRTAAIGKWGVGKPLPDNHPNMYGCEHFFGYVDTTGAHNFYPARLTRDGAPQALPNVLDPSRPNVAREKRVYAPDLLIEDALRWIDAQTDRPFFLYFTPNMPHANNEAGAATGDGMELPPGYAPFAQKDWPAPEKGFAGMVTLLDAYVGRILERLRARGLDRRTLVVFTSDNGPHGEGGHKETFFKSSGPLRGMKRDLYEGGIRVPCIAWWPGTIVPGAACAQACAFQDFLPTCAALAGTACPDTDGVSLAVMLAGDAQALPRARPLYWEFYERGGSRAVLLDGRWKGVQLNWTKRPDGPWELYDLAADEAETKDIAAGRPDIVARLLAAAKEAHKDMPASPAAAQGAKAKQRQQ